MLHFRFERKFILIAATLFAACAVAAVALSPAASDEMRPLLQSLGVISCSSSTPCQEGKNSSTGPGLEGISAKGKGVLGLTTFNSTSSSNGQAGVLGQDSSASGSFDVGVRGISSKGIGVIGTSTSSTGVEGVSSSGRGVIGISSSFIGVNGSSPSGTGVSGTSTSGIGVRGVSSTASGVQGVSNISDAVQGVIGSGVASSFHAGVAGIDSSTSGATNEGVYGQSTNGIGIQAVSSNFIGEQVSGGKSIGSDLYPALSVNGGAADLLDVCNSGGPNPCRTNFSLPAPQFDLDIFGDIFITGFITTAGTCHNGCASSPGIGEKRVRLFTPQESLPTVEDFGEAQLVGGRTYVRIDPAFANTMDGHAGYIVLITPEGDSNGLYVVNKTATGFEVHENRAGRSTLAFSYRIVAKPFGEHPVRLQMITVSKPGRSLPQPRIR